MNTASLHNIEDLCVLFRCRPEESQNILIVLETITSAIVITNTAGKFVYVNKRATELYGIDYAGFELAEHISSIKALRLDGSPFPFEDMPISHSLKSDQVVRNVEMFIENTNGVRYLANVSSAPLHDSCGNISGAIVIFDDFTQCKQTEKALRESEGRHAFLLKLSDALRPLSDPYEIQATVTRTAMDCFGADRCFYCEIESGSVIIWRDACRSDLPSVVGVYSQINLPIHKALIDAGKPFCFADVRATDQVDEELRQICIELKVISCLEVPVVKGSKTVGIFCIAQSCPRDWTDTDAELAVEIAERTRAAAERARAEGGLRKSEKMANALVLELENANRNKNEFISILSHELRNPLAAISAGIQMLDFSQDVGQTQKAKEIMKRQINQLCKLVDELLDLSRIDQNKIKLKKEHILLNELVKSAVEDIRLEYEIKGVELGMQIQAEPVSLYADPTRITQLVGNILSNALKFTQEGDTVRLTLQTDGDQAVIAIEDNGIGISPELLPHLFKPFMQVESTLHRSRGGLGLGLFIVKGIVDLHDGGVSAFSEGLGKGSVFTITLPLMPTNAST